MSCNKQRDSEEEGISPCLTADREKKKINSSE